MQGIKTLCFLLIALLLACTASEPTETPTPEPLPHQEADIEVQCSIVPATADHETPLAADDEACQEQIEIDLGDKVVIRVTPIAMGLVQYTLRSSTGDLNMVLNQNTIETVHVTDENLSLALAIDDDWRNAREIESALNGYYELVAEAAGTTTITISAHGETSDFMWNGNEWVSLFTFRTVASDPIEIIVMDINSP